MRKGEVRKILRQYRKGTVEKDQYLERKKEYEDWRRKKRERHEKEEKVKLRGIIYR